MAQDDGAATMNGVDETQLVQIVAGATDQQLEELMASEARKEILDDVFRRMSEHVDGERARDVTAIVHWKIYDRPDGGYDHYEVVLEAGECSVSDSPSREPAVTLKLKPADFLKLGSIAVDKGIAKLGSPADFYAQLEPDAIAEHILASARGDIRRVVERIMEREHPRLWRDVPPRVREAVHERVQQQLPDIVHAVTDEIGDNIDQLLDVKLMVIRRMEERPELVNRIYLEVGGRELRFIINFGFLFGFVLGIPMAFITLAVPYWWVLPLGGVVIGYATNWVALWMIFEPTERRRVGPFTLQGLFLRRQPEASDVYAEIIADDVVTLA